MLTVIALALVVGGAELASSDSVIVQYAPPALSVRITAETPLDRVIATICARVDAGCDPFPEDSALPLVAPRVLSGSWESVLEQLMAESGFGFATTPATRSRGPQLVLGARKGASAASGPGETPQEPSPQAGTEVAEPPQPAYEEPAPEPELAATAAPEPEPPPAVSSSQNRFASASPFGGAAPQVAPPRPVATPMAAPGGGPLNQVIAPDPSQAEGWIATPFSDENGAALTVQAAPDTSGMTPFAGPDGQPIVIDPPVPAAPGEPPVSPFPNPTQP